MIPTINPPSSRTVSRSCLADSRKGHCIGCAASAERLNSVTSITSSTASCHAWWNVPLISIRYRAEFTQRRSHLRDGTRYHTQKPDAYETLRAIIPLHETFGLHRARVRAALRLAVHARVHNAEIESLAVLHRGRSVRIQHVTFVEHGLHDAVHERRVHDRTVSGRALKALSSAFSHVGMPSRTLN